MKLSEMVSEWEAELTALKKDADSIAEETSKYIATISRYSQLKSCINKIKSMMLISEEMEINGMIIYPSSYEISINGDRQFIPKKEFLVLNYLINNPDRCVSRKELIKNCWEDDVIIGERTVDVHICKIKKRIKNRIKIYVHKGVGYRWKIN
jgi:two-component system alkaline phosphatase synthesis response regulator PhoP